MSLYKAEAIILKARNYSEADKILTLFTKEYGKVEALARGVRKIKSKNRGAVQPFSRSQIMLYKGRTVDTVTQCELIEGFPEIRSNLDCLAYAGYLTELTNLLQPEHEQNVELYYLLLAALHLMASAVFTPPLEGVNASNESPEMVARWFEVRLLNLLGYQPVLESCVICSKKIMPGLALKFSADSGGVLCPDCYQFDLQAMAVRQGTVAVWKQLAVIEPRHLGRLKVTQQDRELLAAVLTHFIEHQLERKLKAGAFLQELNKFQPTI